MENENTSRIVQAPGIETNQDEMARLPIVRYNIKAEDSRGTKRRTLSLKILGIL